MQCLGFNKLFFLANNATSSAKRKTLWSSMGIEAVLFLQPVCSQQNDTAELLGEETLSHL